MIKALLSFIWAACTIMGMYWLGIAAIRLDTYSNGSGFLFMCLGICILGAASFLSAVALKLNDAAKEE